MEKAAGLYNAGRHGEAAAIYRDLLIRDPANVQIMHYLALVAMHLDQAPVVLSLAEAGLRIRPGMALLHQDRATALRRLGRRQEALEAIEKALEISPATADFYDTRATILRDLRQHDKAVESMRKAADIDPQNASYANNLGIALGRIGRFEEALSWIGRYIALKPGLAAGYLNKANILKSLNRHDDAIAWYDKALAIDAHAFMGKGNKAFCHLVMGDFEKGWPLFEHRRPGALPPEGKRFDASRRWKGEATQARLVLYNEQGLGDTVQFCRYVPLVRARAPNLVLQAQEPLVPLLARQWPELEIASDAAAPPDYGLQCPLMSLPGLFKTDAASIPSPSGYLQPDPAKAEAWRARLPRDGRKKIGAVWAGNPEHQKDHLRSMSFAQFAPLLAVPDVHFVSLQKGEPRPDASALPPGASFFAPADDLNDFSDSAALLANLDLLIAVDTAMLHLAGALGVPAFGLIPTDPDWRWMLNRTGTPWYDSLRLFRQSRHDDWPSVIAETREALKKLP